MKAFTLLEILLALIFVSILATFGYVWFSDSKLHLAREQIIMHLNHTRFLALTSVKHITQAPFCQSNLCTIERKNYKESFWRLQFSELKNIGFAYYIFGDFARLTAQSTLHFDDRPRNKEEIARDFLDNKYLNVYSMSNSKFANNLRAGDLAITKRYGVQKVQMRGGCGDDDRGARVLFNPQGFLRCKREFQNLSNPLGEVRIILYGESGKSVAICILESGFIQKC